MGMAATPDMKRLKDGSLEISNLKVDDAGDYECKVLVSTVNPPTITHHLKINVPPAIKSLTALNNVTVVCFFKNLILLAVFLLFA